MKPLSVAMASLLGIQNEIQAVCAVCFYQSTLYINKLMVRNKKAEAGT